MRSIGKKKVKYWPLCNISCSTILAAVKNGFKKIQGVAYDGAYGASIDRSTLCKTVAKTGRGTS